jgi:GGDEF domain-containing protein
MKQELFNALQQMAAVDLYEAMFIDPVTKILNRTAFENCSPYEAIAIIDLDSLKYLNDTVGHREGDKYLHFLAEKLSTHFGRDNVYRLSGDEFVVTGTNPFQLDVDLNNLQVVYKIFSYGIATNLDEADTRLNYNKAVREKTGVRASRGEQPPWFGKMAL